MGRRALLIGIDSYSDPKLSLSAPKHDVTRLHQMLTSAGYPAGEVRDLIDSETRSLSANRLRYDIGEFFRAARPDDELLLYISGHGIEQDGFRLIVPSDYYTSRAQPADSLVGDHELYAEARRSPARSILMIFDCCRDGFHLELVSDSPVSKSVPAAKPSAAPPADAPTIAIVYSCRSGEQSYAERQENGASYFTMALCQVLGAENQPAALEEVTAATQQVLTGLLAGTSRTQTVTLDERRINGRGGSPLRLLVKESRDARSRQRIADSKWCRELEGCDWWSKVEEGGPGLALQVKWIALCAEDLFVEAERRLPNQRWRDRAAPDRVIRRLTMLLDRCENCLSPPEKALALSVPYVYEAVLAAAELHLAESGDPLNPADGAIGHQAWKALHGAFAAEEGLARRRESLQRQQLTEAADDLAAWQLTRFLHSSGELWSYRSQDSGASVNWVKLALEAFFADAPFPETRDERVRGLLQGQRLVRLARLSFSSREDIEFHWALRGDEHLQEDVRFGEGKEEWRVNEVAVTELLVLAFGLACDPRRMPLALAEHVGGPTEVVAAYIREILNGLKWRWEDEAVVADLECPLEILDLTIEGVVDTLNLHRQRHGENEKFPRPLMAALPRTFSRERVEPIGKKQGRPLYVRPHLQLTYSQSRVRDLFMGQSLYGKPELALREMYQNALDACRYRQCRVRYLEATRQRFDKYDPLIEFRAGRLDGRAYIECQDNGVGMGDRHVRTLFAQAGRRFTDSHEFHLERAAWEEHGIKFWPNSRFGIGVFSYFMLADELQVETRRLAQNGIDYEEGLRLISVGSGSLLRVQRPDAVRPGTLVRLFLNDPGLLDRFVDEIHKWLWLPEFNTVLTDATNKTQHLEGGRPAPGFLEATGPVRPVMDSAGANGQPRLFFWRKTEDRYMLSVYDNTLLVDGIRTEPDRELLGVRELPVSGVVLNLTQDFQPRLSMDRARLMSLDSASVWLANELRRGAFRDLLGIPDLRLEDLDVFASRPLVLILLDRSLREGSIPAAGARILVDGDRPPLVLTGVGLAPLLDHVILKRLRPVSAKEATSESDKQETATANLPSRIRFARAIAARLAALRRAGLELKGASFRRLANFAAASGWSDAPSMALVLLSRSPYQDEFDFAMRSWFVVRNLELAALDEGEVDDIAAELDGWQEQETLLSAIDLFRKTRNQPPPDPRLKPIFELGLPLEKRQHDWRVTFPALALASRVTGRTVANLVAALAAINHPEVTYPQIDELPGDALPSARALLLLSAAGRAESVKGLSHLFPRQDPDADLSSLRQWGGVGPLLHELRWRDLAWAVVHWKMDRAALTKLVQPLAEWGVIVPDLRSAQASVLDDPLAASLLSLTNPDQRGGPPKDLDLAALIQVAKTIRPHGQSFLQVRQQAARLVDCGVAVPELEHLPAELPADDRALQLWTEDLSGDGALSTSLTLRHFALAALKWNLPLSEVAAIAAQLAPWGVELPDRAGLDLDPRLLGRVREILSEKGDGQAPWVTVVPLQRLIVASEQWGEPFDVRLQPLRAWISVLTDRSLPDDPIVVDRPLRELLARQSDLKWTDTVTSWDLAITAHDQEADPADHVQALEMLARCGVEVAAALEFARFSVEDRSRDAASADPPSRPN